jgi:hypothetical protein
VTNRIEVTGEPIGTVAFEGPGAGGRATSSAVLGDLVALAIGAGSTWAGLPEAGPLSLARATDGAAGDADGSGRSVTIELAGVAYPALEA